MIIQKVKAQLPEDAKIKAKTSDKEPKVSNQATGGGKHKVKASEKPKNAPNIKKWEAKGGEVWKNDDGSITYKDWEGNEVKYHGDVADFKEGGHVTKEVQIENMQGDHYYDYKKANVEAGYGDGPFDHPDGTTWHHKDTTTMQSVDSEIHSRFTHKGAVSDLKKINQ